MDKKSQILMSVLGVFALVIVTVGVSYAFFTYTRTSSQTNTIQSGKISFYYTEESNGLAVKDVMPVADATALAEGSANNGNSNVATFEFNVGSTELSGVTIGYDVFLQKQTVTNGLADNQVKFVLNATTGDKNETITNNISTPTYATNFFTSSNNEYKIASGVIKGTNADTYDLRMWLSSENANLNISADDGGSGVISEGPNYSVTDEGQGVVSTWGGKQYSTKVRVATTNVKTVGE